MKIPKISPTKNHKPKLFPSLNLEQFHQLKAKGNTLNSYQTVDEILSKRKTRKYHLEEYCRKKLQRSIDFPRINKSVEYKPLVNGDFVCAIENKQLRNQKRHTDRLRL